MMRSPKAVPATSTRIGVNGSGTAGAGTPGGDCGFREGGASLPPAVGMVGGKVVPEGSSIVVLLLLPVVKIPEPSV